MAFDQFMQRTRLERERRTRPLCGCHTALGYLPQVKIDVHTVILENIAQTTLVQTFVNPSKDQPIYEINYIFPLYDGVSVVGFKCTIVDRVIDGVVKERQEANNDYSKAKAEGKTAVLLGQSLKASDVFTMSIGNMPAREKATIEITYLSELHHDAEIDGIRFTIPTYIAPRYGQKGFVEEKASEVKEEGISITVDVEMSGDSAIKTIQSPSHPISVSMADSTALLQKGSVTLCQDSAQLNRDFVVELIPAQLIEPVALMETHPTIPNQRAIMTTLVPKFKLPAEKPEIVFLCDRSGSMGGARIKNLVAALQIFLQSLPVGVKFNIGSFGSRHDFLWDRSKTYSQETLDEAVAHVKEFGANYGGTKVYEPMEATFEKKYNDMNLEVFLLTDGQIDDQKEVFELVNDWVSRSQSSIRVFTLGIGSGVSTAMLGGVARAGNGFAQMIQDSEKMSKKVVRMLRSSLSPHIHDYRLEVKYEEADETDEDFELVETPADVGVPKQPQEEKASSVEVKSTSLFDPSFDDAQDLAGHASAKVGKYDHLPSIVIPEYLQTPSQIPQLYSFNRTTVHLLLDSAPKEPKSVILRGTSAHGPLELEIPIVKLAKESSMIHQLAARKEIRELEDGRGWLTIVKHNDQLLKDKYEGMFPDMVEREAVRLGVKFQVAGKWTSVVGVEASASKSINHGEVDLEAFNANHQATRGVPLTKKKKDYGRFNLDDEEEEDAPLDPSLDGPVSLSAMNLPPLTDERMRQIDRIMIKSDNVDDTTRMSRTRLRSIKYSPAEMLEARTAPAGDDTPIQPMDSFVSVSAINLGLSIDERNRQIDRIMTKSDACDDSSRSGRERLSSIKYSPAQMMAARAAPAGEAATKIGWRVRAAMAESDREREAEKTRQSQRAQRTGSTSRASGFPMGAFGAPSGSLGQQLSMALMSRKASPRSGDVVRTARSQALSLGRAANLPETSSQAPSEKPPLSPAEKLQAIIAFQTFVGNWTWDPELEKLLEATREDASKLQLPDVIANSPDKDNILATCCAMLFIKTKLKEYEETWEMLMEKADGWLEAQVGGDSTELVKIVSSLFNSI